MPCFPLPSVGTPGLPQSPALLPKEPEASRGEQAPRPWATSAPPPSPLPPLKWHPAPRSRVPLWAYTCIHTHAHTCEQGHAHRALRSLHLLLARPPTWSLVPSHPTPASLQPSPRGPLRPTQPRRPCGGLAFTLVCPVNLPATPEVDTVTTPSQASEGYRGREVAEDRLRPRARSPRLRHAACPAPQAPASPRAAPPRVRGHSRDHGRSAPGPPRPRLVQELALRGHTRPHQCFKNRALGAPPPQEGSCGGSGRGLEDGDPQVPVGRPCPKRPPTCTPSLFSVQLPSSPSLTVLGLGDEDGHTMCNWGGGTNLQTGRAPPPMDRPAR